MKKQLYWLVESNGDLSVTVKNTEELKSTIEADFAHESENDDFKIENLQYTITPQMLTREEYDALGEAGN